ncbi:ParB/RepB/Spo0J family partition protein [Pantoea sp.]|uniref:ParB/RepB/Spo0J family partition protein n=2 Tax=Erwiniaceae TaxID=1903409 RepID=UPI00290FE47C|nr:ParB/RepB/Spo0J family partition protein [Pantoea sp.]MDU5476077.1 ParB/RepB/Spo0J family partition protein [Pantoea sp.]
MKRVSEELARAASMVENGEREDMHPAEQIAGFQALADEGKTSAQIGDLMGYGSRHVQRCLKLTNLAPTILDELAADNITIEQCQALTLADSHERQIEVWDQASSYYNPSADIIRNLITSTETEISRSPKFAFVGKDAYLAAGGTVRADLFSGEDDGYIETELVERLTLEKLQQVAESVVKQEGFAWTEVRMDGRMHAWDSKVKRSYVVTEERCPDYSPEEDAQVSELRAQLNLTDDNELKPQLKMQMAELENVANKRFWSALDKNKTGAIICYEYGQCYIQRGVQRVSDLPKKTRADSKDDLQALSEGYSAALVRSMSCERSLAVQAALCTNTSMSMAMLTWTLRRSTFSHGSYDNTPMKISLTDNSHALVSDSPAKEGGKAWQFLQKEKKQWESSLPENWAQDFRWLLDWRDELVHGLLAFCSALAVCSFQDRVYGNSQTSSLDALETAMDFDLAEWWQPTAKGFFKRMSKDQIVGALTDAGKTGNASDAEKMKKGDAAEFAEQALKDSRWVPEWMKPLKAETPKNGSSDTQGS